MVQGDDGGDVDGGSGGKMAMVVVMVFGERGGLTGYRQMFFPFVLQAATHGAPTLSLSLSLSLFLFLSFTLYSSAVQTKEHPRLPCLRRTRRNR
ncbi:hypothetical protein M0802_017002 [Mischocyttarus mexicanus]|nr:hypothetical protein M0802_017002 [Mischocyttarus mexicanus]